MLILGAGRGGIAMLEMFLEDDLVRVVGIADKSADAPAFALAREHGIPVYLDPEEALRACRKFEHCIVYNLTHDDSLTAIAHQVLGYAAATAGPEAKLIWQMVTNLKRVKTELESSQRQLKAIFDHAMDGIITVDESGAIQGFNPAAESIFGYAQAEVLRKPLDLLLPAAIQADGTAPMQRFLALQEPADARAAQLLAVRKSGETFPIELSASEMALEGKRYFIGIARDITERKQTEERIERMAHHDFLTGLANRALFRDRLEQAIAQAARQGTRLAVLFLDLDGFKSVNDAVGHEAGDKLLCDVAARLRQIVRAADSVARIGGDEFTFILGNLRERIDAERVARKIVQAIAEPFEISNKFWSIGASIGIATYPDDAQDYENLVKAADAAMYQSKRSGKSTYTFFDARTRE